ncbi:hypothetical protein K438DRAFT_1843158 [Mycena galopus ATCC 62051]|nr:hypothetical protein K438DRAFT_1843158 [Mycena galopus ATCC 62051]
MRAGMDSGARAACRDMLDHSFCPLLIRSFTDAFSFLDCVGGMAPGPVHTRSHSFTPKLSSRLANLGGTNPARKNSAGELDDTNRKDGKEKEKRGVGFPFHFGGAATQNKNHPPAPSPDAAQLLAPPHIILEPAPEGDGAASSANPRNTTYTLRNTAYVDASAADKRASQIIYATGFVNRLVTLALVEAV